MRIKKILILFCLIMMMGCQKNSENNYLQSGLKLVQKNKYEESIQYFTESINNDSQKEDVYTGLIIVYTLMEDNNHVNYYTQLILDSYSNEAVNILERAKKELENLDKTDTYLNDVINSVKNNEFIYQKTPIWIIEPQFDFDNVDIVNDNDYRITAGSHMNGSENYEACYPNEVSEEIGNLRNCIGYYDSGFVKVKKNNQFGIYDFAGNIIKPLGDDDFEFGYTYVYDDGFKVYCGYTTTKEIYDSFGAIDYYDVTYYGKNFEENRKIKGTPLFATYNSFLSKSGEYVDLCDMFSCFSFNEEILSESTGAFYIDSQNIMDQSGKLIHLNGYIVEGISNGFIRATNKEINYWIDNPKLDDYRFGFYDLSGNLIADFIYEDAYDFTDGYAAVKYNGLWGYIDTSGNIAVPFIFDEARPLYAGKAWVKKDGSWGILDVIQSISEQVDFSK